MMTMMRMVGSDLVAKFRGVWHMKHYVATNFVVLGWGRSFGGRFRAFSPRGTTFWLLREVRARDGSRSNRFALGANARPGAFDW